MNLIKTIQEKLKVQFNAALTAEEKQALKDYHTKMELELNPPAPKLMEAKTKEGVTVSYEGELKEGTPLTVVTPEGSMPAPDGDHELEDGTIVSVASGLVTAVKKVDTPSPEEEMKKAEEMKNTMAAQFSVQKTELEKALDVKFAAKESELKAQIDELKKVQLSTLGALDKILNMPIDTIVIEEKKKTWEEMTPAERYALENPID